MSVFLTGGILLEFVVPALALFGGDLQIPMHAQLGLGAWLPVPTLVCVCDLFVPMLESLASHPSPSVCWAWHLWLVCSCLRACVFVYVDGREGGGLGICVRYFGWLA